MQKYHQPYQQETGKNINFDIEQLWQRPDKLAKWYKQRQKEDKEETTESKQKTQTRQKRKQNKLNTHTKYGRN